MKKLGEILKETRIQKNITEEEAAANLLIKKEIIKALEDGNWQALPDVAYVKGFIKNYADFLGLDTNRLLALHRGEYDEKKYEVKQQKSKKRLMLTPNLIVPTMFTIAILIFASYLLFQYTSVLKAPQVEIFSPENDITTTASVIEISGKAEKDSTISIDGQLIPIDEFGNFSYQIKLDEGQNIIEIIGSKRLSPKTKIQRIIRLSR